MRISERWMDDAACESMPVSMFYSDRGSRANQRTNDEARAKRLCATCPVRVECLTYALMLESKRLVIGVAQFESCGTCHGEDFACENDKHKPHPLTSECSTCDGTGEIAKQKDMSIKPQSAGIWGGQTAKERTRVNIRHLPGCKRKGHGACRPLVEQVRLLEELFRARIHKDRVLLPGEEVA